MHVLLVTYYPLFARHLAGGAQTAIMTQVRSLVAQGFRFRVLCPQLGPYSAPNHQFIEVRPLLREVTAVAPSLDRQSENIQIVTDASHDVDVIWMVDRAIPIVSRLPTVLSYMTLGIYPDEFVALYDTNWDALIVPSNFSRDAISAKLPHFRRMRSQPPIHVVPPAIDPAIAFAGRRGVLARWFRHDPSTKYILFPHRPEVAKGHHDMLEAMSLVVARDPTFHLLVPLPPVSLRYDIEGERAFIDSVQKRVESLKLRSHVTFHAWINSMRKPNYYSNGTCYVNLSRLPETFGLGLAEAIGAGTPAISYGNGALSETVPHGLGHHVLQRANVEDVANALVAVSAERNGIQRGREFVRERYGMVNCGVRLRHILETTVKADRSSWY